MVKEIQKSSCSGCSGLSNGVQCIPLQHFFLNSLDLFDFTFSWIVWIDKLHNWVEEVFFFNFS